MEQEAEETNVLSLEGLGRQQWRREKVTAPGRPPQGRQGVGVAVAAASRGLGMGRRLTGVGRVAAWRQPSYPYP